ncbi:MAG: hypothetical protein GX552_10605 [Chloroflexi bacterium]|jgi:hypothetical protein|nr:hypothetical protein [Chloroflexota bacterium]
MNNEPITPEKMDALLRFLPLFDVPEREYVRERADGYPVYHDDVRAFFGLLASESCWMDYDYRPSEAAHLLADDAFVARARLDDLRTMLTYCLRGERFGDGFWETILRPTEGRPSRVVALLRRLKAIRDELE